MIDPVELKHKLKKLRLEKKIVFTNGCFDLLHPGHVEYLRRAKSLGDILIVGINDDSSVASLKGPRRPIMPLEARAGILASLEMVDLVVPFSGLTAEELVREIRPDVYVKGGDYRLEEIPEARVVKEYGGVVKIVQLEPGWSTSRIIDRILSSCRRDK